MDSMRTEELVSIIVPVYNVERQLKRCVDSLLAQTYKKIEIILVDDGSGDSSGEICDCYSRFPVVHVIHKANGGLSDARNVGLKALSGSWVTFVDSDDFVSPYFVERMLGAALDNGADIVECQFEKVFDDTDVVWRFPDGSVETLNKKEAVSKFLNYDGTWIMAWNKLYRADLFEHINFPVGRLNEDEFVTPYLVDSCKRYSIVSDVLYAYYQRPGSIMNSGFTSARLDVLSAHQERFVYFSAEYGGEYDGVVAYHWLACATKIATKYRKQMDVIQTELVDEQRRQCLGILSKTKISFSMRLRSLAYRWFPDVVAALVMRRAE